MIFFISIGKSYDGEIRNSKKISFLEYFSSGIQTEIKNIDRDDVSHVLFYDLRSQTNGKSLYAQMILDDLRRGEWVSLRSWGVGRTWHVDGGQSSEIGTRVKDDSVHSQFIAVREILNDDIFIEETNTSRRLDFHHIMNLYLIHVLNFVDDFF